MTPDQITQSVETIRGCCLDQARAEMVARIATLQDTARALVGDIPESVGGHRLNVEDLCNAALQPNGIDHPRIAQAVNERADALLAALVRDTLTTISGTKRGNKKVA